MPFEGVNAGPPPVRGGSTSSPRAAAPKRASGKQRVREEAAAGVFQIVGFGAMLAGWHADAGAIQVHGPGIAHGVASMAEGNPKIAAGLDKLAETGPYGEAIILIMPLALQLMANHGLVKPELVASAGVVHPDTLAADVKAQMATQAHEALLRQKAAEAELTRLHAEMSAATNGAGTPSSQRANDGY